MKICVLVKEVPDAAVDKRINPSTGRLDRSGERNLNPYDTHAIEAAMQIREGGAVEVDEIVAVTMGPDTAVRALHKAVSLGADRSVHLSDEALAGSDVAATGYALAKVLESESPDLVLLGQQSDDGECYTIGAVVADHLQMPSLTQVIKMDVVRGLAALRAPGRVRLRHRRGRDARPSSPSATRSTSRATRRSRRSWAPRRSRWTPRPAATSASTPSKVGGDGSAVQCGDFKAPPQKAGGTIIEDEDTNETVEKIVAWLDERKLI